MPLLGQGSQRLHQQLEGRRRDGQLARPGAEGATPDADQVAGVEATILRERRVTQCVAPQVRLQRSAAVLEGDEPGLAEVADCHHAAGDGDVGRACELLVAERREALVDLGGAVIRPEVVGKGGLLPLAQGRELPPPDHDLLVVVGHASIVQKSRGVTGWRAGGQGSSVLPASIRKSTERAPPPTRSATTAS